jgi:hypothetical protein
MMIRYLLFSVLAIAILFSACKKSYENNGDNNNPGTSDEVMSCIIDNQVYDFKDIDARLIVSSNEENLEITAYVDKGSVQNQTYIELQVLKRPSLSEGEFLMNNDLNKDTVVNMYFSEMSNAIGANWDSKNNIGQVNITEIDRENLTVSGTFSAKLRLFVAVGGGDYPEEIEITNGTFNKVNYLVTD